MKHNRQEVIDRLGAVGISKDDALALRRISMTLHRWHEMECGDSNVNASYSLERDEETGKPYMRTLYHGPGMGAMPRETITPVADREAGARKRLAAIMRRYPSLHAYIQSDPRGAALYILRPGDVPDGADVSAYYSRGIAVYK